MDLLAVTLVRPTLQGESHAILNLAAKKELMERISQVFDGFPMMHSNGGVWQIGEIQLVEDASNEPELHHLAMNFVTTPLHDIPYSFDSMPIVEWQGERWRYDIHRDSLHAVARTAVECPIPKEVELPVIKPRRVKFNSKFNPRVKCDNCDWDGLADEGNEIKDLAQRVEPGGEVPACECPICGALAYISANLKNRRRIVILLDAHASAVEDVFCDATDIDLEVVITDSSGEFRKEDSVQVGTTGDYIVDYHDVADLLSRHRRLELVKALNAHKKKLQRPAACEEKSTPPPA